MPTLRNSLDPDEAGRRWNGVTPSHRAPAWFRALMGGLSDAVTATHGSIAGIVAHSFGTATTLAARTRHGLDVPRLAGLAPSALLGRMLCDFADMTGLGQSVVERMSDRLAAAFDFRWADLEADTIAPRLGCPALVIHDRDDRRVPHADGVELARLLPDARLVTTEGLGHSGPLLRDADVLDEVGRFMASHPAIPLPRPTSIIEPVGTVE